MPLKGLDNVNRAIRDLVASKDRSLRVEFVRTFGEIIIGTPVDKGRARGNWFLSSGAPSKKLINPKKWEKRPDEDLNKMTKKVTGKKTFLTNNLPYIEELEYGGISEWAPTGWVRKAIIRLRQRIKKI